MHMRIRVIAAVVAVLFALPARAQSVSVSHSGYLLTAGDAHTELRQVNAPLKLAPGTWCRDGDATLVCVALPKGASQLELAG